LRLTTGAAVAGFWLIYSNSLFFGISALLTQSAYFEPAVLQEGVIIGWQVFN
jgi:hypothetical protein